MLHLYQSNRLEYLADLMCQLQASQPLDNPFASEEIVVQSQGMRRFISQYLAEKQGIAANLRFSLPAGLSWRLMRELLPNTPELSPFSPEVLRWRLFQLFQSDRFQKTDEFQATRDVLNSYLAQGEYSAYQLAGQLADVLDQYLVYRPEWIEAWTHGKNIPELEQSPISKNLQIWQAQLWRFLDDGQQNASHRVQLWRDLMAELSVKNARLPERFFVFGIATLAPMYLTLLKQLSIHCEIHILALNPSAQYWGNVIEPAHILLQDDMDLNLQGHPLLASLGKQGRDFFNELTDLEAQLDIDVFDNQRVSPSLLHTLQHHIQTQTLPEQDTAWSEQHLDFLKEKVFPKNTRAEQIFQASLHDDSVPENYRPALAQLRADESIQIHSAHSPLRELHVLKDKILHILHTHPTWQPHDIAVLTPHIEPYAPFIEAVFGEHSGRALPYTLSDVKLSRRQPLLDALEHILSLLISRFEVDKLLPILDNELILNKFNLTQEDLPLLHDTIAQLNIHWGANQAQRAEFGDDSVLFTWQQAIERLILGWLVPENKQQNLWQNKIAFHSRPDHLNVLSAFSQLIRALNDIREIWQTPVSIEEWTNRVRQLLNQFFAPTADDQNALQQLEQTLSQWQAEAQLARLDLTISADIAVQHVQRFLSSQNEDRFLRGGITFCSMVPMRSLPFKVLCLLGLNDGDYPRINKASHFDLIAKHPKKGDRARRDDDRYLFLEAILSAREILYLSFVGKDIRTDEARAPSALIHELSDCVASLAGVPSSELARFWQVSHPLQSFSRQYFSNNAHAHLFSSRQDYAQALNAPPKIHGDFVAPPSEVFSVDANQIVEQKEFLQFWRNPVRSYLRYALNWQAPRNPATWDSAEPFHVSQTRRLQDAYVLARKNHQPFEELAKQLRAQSLLPTGILGELTEEYYAIQAKKLDADLLNSARLPERSGVLAGETGCLNFRLNHNHERGQILYAAQFLKPFNEHGRLYASDTVELLLSHLIYCAATPDDVPSRYTHLIKLDNPITLPPIAQAAARESLAKWLAVYQAGQTFPQPFFPRVSLQAAVAMFAPKKPEDATWQKAIEAAAKVYHTGFNVNGLDNYPEIQLVYGRNNDDEPPYLSPLFRQLTMNLFEVFEACLKELNATNDT